MNRIISAGLISGISGALLTGCASADLAVKRPHEGIVSAIAEDTRPKYSVVFDCWTTLKIH